MNSNDKQPTDDREKLPKQSEEQAKLEDAIKWSMFGGEEPTAEQMEKAKESLKARKRSDSEQETGGGAP